MLDVRDTVDGSESRRSPVEVGKICHYLQGLMIMPGGAGFLPLTVFGYILANCRDQPDCWSSQMVLS